MALEGPLSEIRVLDFSRYVSGPHCTRAMADMGADVVKVESAEQDFTKTLPPVIGKLSGFYIQQNAGKRSLCFHLRHPGVPDVIRRLLPQFDVLVENFRPGVMAALGLSYDECRAINPRLVYASISGWGQAGPDSDRVAFAIAVHAEAGIIARELAYNPTPDAAAGPYSHADVYTGLEALAGVLAALYQRQRTGVGQYVDVTMMSTMLAVNEHANAELNEEPNYEVASLAPIMRLGDRSVAMAADPIDPFYFVKFMAAMDRPSLADDPRFATESDRRRHRRELTAVVQEWFDTFETFDELYQKMASVGMRCGLVRTVNEVGASPWAKYRGAVVEVSDGSNGTLKIPNSPYQFSDAQVEVRGNAPHLGEHNDEVLREAGFTAAEIEAMIDNGLLATE